MQKYSISLKYASKKRNTAKVSCVVGVSMGRDGGVPWQKKCPAPGGAGHREYILSEAVTSLLQIAFLFRFLKCAPLHVTNIRSVRISASGGDDDRRRAFPPPRRWWQPCVTPYFATRGRGDMRGVPNRSTQIAPRRWCRAVLPPWCGVYHLVYHLVVWCNDSLPPPPGWHIWDAVWWSPHVADTPVGEIRGYAQRQPPTGVGNYLAFGPHFHYGGVAAMASQARCSVFT